MASLGATKSGNSHTDFIDFLGVRACVYVRIYICIVACVWMCARARAHTCVSLIRAHLGGSGGIDINFLYVLTNLTRKEYTSTLSDRVGIASIFCLSLARDLRAWILRVTRISYEFLTSRDPRYYFQPLAKRDCGLSPICIQRHKMFREGSTECHWDPSVAFLRGRPISRRDFSEITDGLSELERAANEKSRERLDIGMDSNYEKLRQKNRCESNDNIHSGETSIFSSASYRMNIVLVPFADVIPIELLRLCSSFTWIVNSASLIDW